MTIQELSRDQKKSGVLNGGQTIQRSNFSRRSYDYTQRCDNSRATPAATSADRMIYFRIPKKTSKWLESSPGKHTNNVSRGTSWRLSQSFLGKLESTTHDEWVLSVTKEGFTLEFLQNLYVYGGEKNFNCNCTNYNFVKRGRGINKQKNVIEFVQLQEKLSTF